MLMIVAVVCATLMVACGGEKKSEKCGDLEAISSKDLVGTWKIVIPGFEKSQIVTLNGNGTGEVTLIENGNDYDGTFEITKWFYDSDKTLTMFVALDPEREPEVISYQITETSAGGDKMKATGYLDRQTIKNVTMTRVK